VRQTHLRAHAHPCALAHARGGTRTRALVNVGTPVCVRTSDAPTQAARVHTCADIDVHKRPASALRMLTLTCALRMHQRTGRERAAVLVRPSLSLILPAPLGRSPLARSVSLAPSLVRSLFLILSPSLGQRAEATSAARPGHASHPPSTSHSVSPPQPHLLLDDVSEGEKERRREGGRVDRQWPVLGRARFLHYLVFAKICGR
jgi:hypothetical protein